MTSSKKIKGCEETFFKGKKAFRAEIMINYFSTFRRKNNGAEVCSVCIVLVDESLAHSTYMKTGLPKDLSGFYVKKFCTGKEVLLFLTRSYILYFFA